MKRSCLASLLALLAAACSPRRAPEGPEPPPIVLHGVRLRAYEGSTLTASGYAARLTYERSSGEATAYHATLRLPRHSPPAGHTQIHAPVLQGTLSSRTLTASGGVSLRTPDDVSARTPRATYDGASRLAQGSEGVFIQGPAWALQADSFSLSMPDAAFSFEGSVHTVLGAAR